MAIKKDFTTDTLTRFSEIYTCAGIARDLVNKVQYHAAHYVLTPAEYDALSKAKLVLDNIREKATQPNAIKWINENQPEWPINYEAR